MGKIFLDCGTHMGLGFSRISEILKIDKDKPIKIPNQRPLYQEDKATGMIKNIGNCIVGPVI